MPAREALIERNIALLEQGRSLLARIDATLYARPIAGQRACVGSHFRHCFDFYELFLDGLAGGRIDYDARPRNAAEETDAALAQARADRLIAALGACRIPDDREGLLVRAEAGDDRTQGWHASTAGRELQFLLSHTVHHFAIVALVLRSWGHSVEETFGVAPSTLQHWRSR